MSDSTDYFVDVEGRTYRVVLAPSGFPRRVFRFHHHRALDFGEGLALDGKVGRAAIKKALMQREAARRGTP